MRYTRFGQTDLEVSRICFGTWQFGDWGSTEEHSLSFCLQAFSEYHIP
jgi:aryl-alcohol dehydrogenase-like predicted oxidoreductase